MHSYCITDFLKDFQNMAAKNVCVITDKKVHDFILIQYSLSSNGVGVQLRVLLVCKVELIFADCRGSAIENFLMFFI